MRRHVLVGVERAPEAGPTGEPHQAGGPRCGALRVLALRAVTHEGPSWPVQRACTSLLRDGHVDRAVRDARTVHAARLARVAAALSPHARTVGPAAGMCSVRLTPPRSAVHARDAARAAGFEVNLLADCCRSSTWSGLVVGVGSCTDDELSRALEALAGALAGR